MISSGDAGGGPHHGAGGGGVAGGFVVRPVVGVGMRGLGALRDATARPSRWRMRRVAVRLRASGDRVAAALGRRQQGALGQGALGSGLRRSSLRIVDDGVPACRLAGGERERAVRRSDSASGLDGDLRVDGGLLADARVAYVPLLRSAALPRSSSGGPRRCSRVRSRRRGRARNRSSSDCACGTAPVRSGYRPQ